MNRFLMIGAGGTGTHLLPQLIAYLSTIHESDDQWILGVMDGDSVEPHNLERQLFIPQSVNMAKAEAALLPFSHMRNIKPITQYLGANNIGEYLKEGVTILICVDNFPVRALIEGYCNQHLENFTVINGGNERHTGTCQIWKRVNGKNVTPPLSFNHPEIYMPGPDRAEMSCQEIAMLPGGEQLIVANMASAMWMLNSLMAVVEDRITFTEVEWDVINPKNTVATDYRVLDDWSN